MIKKFLSGLFITELSEHDINKIILDRCTNDLQYCLVDSDLKLIYNALISYSLQHDAAISAIKRVAQINKSVLYNIGGEKINFK